MSIPVILASKSPSRHDLLLHCGINPTVCVSDVDEEAVARQYADNHQGIEISQIPADIHVQILAQAKAQAVAAQYQAVQQCVRAVHGDQITISPLTHSSQGNGSDKNTKENITVTPLADVFNGDSGLSGLTVGPMIIGADSMFAFDGVVYGKPHDKETARARIRAMRNHHGTLWTGHTIIDCASGRQESAVSKAEVYFGNMSDEEIERYLETQEPLEVAGSFTIEGYGGAFIDSVHGDPHGVQGLSIPLLRELMNKFDISWPDLWNIPVKSGSASEATTDTADDATAPLENVHQPGDGWITCDCGHQHWGKNGASGVLVARANPQTGDITDVVLQHRALWSAQGGTWGTPGGAIADGENAVEGALRESYEEAGINPRNINIVGSYKEDHHSWSYTTIFALEKPDHAFDPVAHDDESIAVEWVPVDTVARLPLLDAFGELWPTFLAQLNEASHREYQS